MEVGQMIAKLRKEKNYCQKQLAAQLNLSVSTISNYENGVHYPDYETLCKIADYFGVTTDYLLGRSSYRYNPQKLNEPVTERFHLQDYVDTIFEIDMKYRESVILYAKFLKDQQDAKD